MKYISTERANLFEPDVYITFVAEFSGNITAEKLAEAVKAAYAANESTMSEIVLEKDGSAYYRKNENSGCKVSFDERPWQEIINDSRRMPFAIDQGELVRTFISSHGNGISLIIHAHHLVGDGKSIVILLKDIAAALDGTEPEYKPMLLIDDKYLSERSKFPTGCKLILKNVNRKWAKCGKSFTWDDYYAIHEKYHQRHLSVPIIETYNVVELKESCPKGITLNSFIITKLLSENPDYAVTGIPVSIRENNNSMSNQVSGISLKYRYNSCITYEENLEVFHKMLKNKISKQLYKYFVLHFMECLSPSIIDAVLMQTHGCYSCKLSEKMAHIMGYTDKNSRDLGVTNLGVIDIEPNHKNYEIKDIIFIPPKVSYTKNVVGVSTFGGKLTVCKNEIIKI